MPKKPKPKKFSRKKLLSIVLVIGILLLAVGAGFLVRWLQVQSENQKKEAENINIVDDRPRSVSEAQNLSVQGKYDEARKKIDESLADSSKSSDERYELYIQQGLNYQNQNKHAEALVEYRKAEAIRVDFKVVRLIAEAAELSGNKALAIEYYKKATPLIDPENPIKDSEKSRLEAKIRQLEAS